MIREHILHVTTLMALCHNHLGKQPKEQLEQSGKTEPTAGICEQVHGAIANLQGRHGLCFYSSCLTSSCYVTQCGTDSSTQVLLLL